jgi:hypothetical protein
MLSKELTIKNEEMSEKTMKKSVLEELITNITEKSELAEN